MTRQRLMNISFGTVVFIAVLQGVVLFNISRIQPGDSLLRARGIGSDENDTLTQLRREAHTRAALYNQLIEQRMLVDGMVISRNEDDLPDHLCDSLLFSSLRYRALLALGFHESADDAWQAIQSSRNRGVWWRHPKCREQSLSRDMMMGVMIALESHPPNGRKLLEELLAEIGRRHGSISDGPFFVSYLSPGPAGLLRYLAESYRIPYAKWPWVLKQSFSSIEYDALFLRPGYESHLAGLGVWLELQFNERSKVFNPRSMLGQFDRLVTGAPASKTADFDQKRKIWVAHTIAQANPENLFFITLQLEAEGALSDTVKANLLKRLLVMPQFPSDRLPMDCDRDADYLWQRNAKEFSPSTNRCRRTYSGVDFLWMAGILATD